MSWAAAVRGAGAVGLVLLVAGCGAAEPRAGEPSTSASSPTSASVAEVPGIAAEAVRLRTDVAVGGQVQVRITDTGTEPFSVTSVQLDSPGFAPLPPRPVAARYAPGQVIDLPTPFGAVRCAEAVDPVAARLSVERPNGAVDELVVPLAGGTMAQVFAEQCAVEDVLAVVDISVLDLAASGDALGADVVLTRRSGEDDVVVSALAPSVVLDPVPAQELPVTLAAGEEQLRLPITFDAERCDPHALAETKQPFRFPLTVTVGDGDPVPVDLPLDQAQERQLQEHLARVCTD